MYTIYTDGSCHHADRIGAWAFIASGPDFRCDGYGYEDDTTISRMELKAAIMGLAGLGVRQGPCRVSVYSDSEYVVKGITDRGRARNANQDLWDLLDEVTDAHELVEYQHVRGHSGDDGNERVDMMARGARNYAILTMDENGIFEPQVVIA